MDRLAMTRLLSIAAGLLALSAALYRIGAADSADTPPGLPLEPGAGVRYVQEAAAYAADMTGPNGLSAANGAIRSSAAERLMDNREALGRALIHVAQEGDTSFDGARAQAMAVIGMLRIDRAVDALATQMAFSPQQEGPRVIVGAGMSSDWHYQPAV
jgi:poly-gamma-glutamate capsule biosynthesis protein CapA/YwtB (metallophosphatase superfamily)